jgi:ABC-2 type transport system permease protein
MKTARLFLHYFRFNLSANLEYRASFWIQVFGMFLNNSSFIIFWLILYNQVGEVIQGYRFNDVMFLWSLGTAGYGLGAVFLGNSSSISRIIYTGELDVYLLQPKPVLLNLLASRMIISGWGDLTYGIVLFILTQQLTLSKIILFTGFSVLFALVHVSLRVIYHSLTFFFGNAESFALTASEMVIIFMLYPGSIFKGPVVWILHTLIPAAFIAYIPVELFNEFELKTFIILLGTDLIFILFAVFIFKIGLKYYESGNRIGTRV